MVCLAIATTGDAIAVPTSADPRVVVELVAGEPDIVTPVGITSDGAGGLLVIESHTHFRPDDYKGPAADRIRRFVDTDGNGRADQITTFWEGSHATMGIGRHPTNGWIYVATRDDIFRLKDTTGDGQADQNEPLLSLKSGDKYPHSGLSGFAFAANGDVYFSFGENHAERYELTGADGTTLRGIEGGHFYRMSPEGRQLGLVAIGCWNPFHLTFDKWGRLFAVDNDPDSRPPCRLLHVVPGADFGYKYRNGRKGTHPFTAWNGELPGTLPMVAGTGEAPSGMFACGTGDKLPADYHGDLLVTSWGDHRVERYRLRPQGASFAAERIDFIDGGENFRPVGICAGDDGNIYVTDWVDKSYQLHKQGRIWRLRIQDGAKPQRMPDAVVLEPSEAEKQAERFRTATTEVDEPALWQACENTDPFVAQAARQGLKKRGAINATTVLKGRSAAQRLAIACAWHELNLAAAHARLPELLTDADPSVRIVALRWIGEERLTELRHDLPKVLTAGPVTQQLFACYLAAAEKLDSPPRRDSDEWASDHYLASTLETDGTPSTVTALALRAIHPDDKLLTAKRFERWLASGDETLRLEAVRTLRETKLPERRVLLLRVVQDRRASDLLRAEAAVGLSAGSAADVFRLLTVARTAPTIVAAEVLRGLRGETLTEQHRQLITAIGKRTPALADVVQRLLAGDSLGKLPPDDDIDAWLAIAQQPGDAAAGARIFFRHDLSMCGTCHQMQGRGGKIGPDLTLVANQLELRRLVESILQPSREVAPRFVPWAVQTDDGRQLVGQLLDEQADGTQFFANSHGEQFSLKLKQIAGRHALATSIMPNGLAQRFTPQEFADLIAFLQQSVK
jgi:putative membrane-bound dehydrogenase-like protein